MSPRQGSPLKTIKEEHTNISPKVAPGKAILSLPLNSQLYSNMWTLMVPPQSQKHLSAMVDINLKLM